MKNEKVAKAVGSVALAVSLLLGGTVMAGVQKNFNVSSLDQVSTIASELDADTTVFTNNDLKKFIRLDHNNGEPIYVSVDDDFTAVEKDYVKWSLDYVFGVVGEINDKYKYEIVSEQERLKKTDMGKTTIRFEESDAVFVNGLGMEDEANGLCERRIDKFSTFVNNPTYDTFVITYDRENNSNQDELGQRYTFLHELLHAFGFDDVHTTLAHSRGNDRFCGNTVMSNEIGSKTNCLTPNDYRCIIAAYAPRMNEKELLNFINDYKQKVKEYDESYYGAYSALCENKMGIESSLDTKKGYQANYQRQLTDEKGNVIIENISIEVGEGEFSLKIFDKNGVMLDSAKGKTVDCGSRLIFRNVELKKGLRPLTESNNFIESYINDFVFMKDAKTGKFIFYDLADNDGLYLKDVKQVESHLEKGE